MKLNNKYFLIAFITLGIQFFMGISFANAICENEIRIHCSELMKAHGRTSYGYCSEKKDESIRFWTNVFLEERKKFSSPQEQIRYWQNSKDDKLNGTNNEDMKQSVKTEGEVDMCILKHALGVGNSGSSSQSSSSSSSSQSNKKAIQQSANNQSSSSSSSDLSNKSQEQLFEILDSAENRGDYAQAYAAEKQLAKDPSAFIKRQALRRIGYRLAEGRGVKINLNEARKYFEQASGMGDLDASANLCVFNILGKGAPENHKKAMEYCLFAAEKGHATAQYNLAWLYQSGNGIQRDKALSDMWTCKAAAQGDEMAVSNAKKAKISCD